MPSRRLRELRVHWKTWPGLPSLDDLEGAIRANPATQRLLVDEGDVDGALAAAAQPMPRTYVWPYQMHASIGPSCALAHWQPEGEQGPALRVWAGSQNPHVLRADLARLMGVDDVAVDVVRMEAAGCYGRNGADDVAADAALLARAVGAPVRVQLTREQEHRVGAQGRGAAHAGPRRPRCRRRRRGLRLRDLLSRRTARRRWRCCSRAPSSRWRRPSRWATAPRGRPTPTANLRVKVNDMAPIVRASWLRGVSALPSSFAHESYVDELATAAGVDPVAFRLRHLHDPRAAELVRETAQKAGWRMRTGPQENADGGLGAGGDVLFGQGFAYARYVHSKWPGFGAAWSAWVADVEVNRKTGEVHVRRVVVGHDAGLMVNPAGVEHQMHGNVIQTTSRALKERVQFAPQTGAESAGVVASREWGSYPIINFREVPVIEVMHMQRPGEPPLGAGESSSVPGTAAIANAIFDATGVRFRAPPFTPEVVRAALNPVRPRFLRLRQTVAARAASRHEGRAAVPPSQPPPGREQAQGRRGPSPLRCRRRHRRHRGPARLALHHRARRLQRAGLQRRPPSNAAACSPRSATAPSATPRRAARPTPAAARWRRPSARSTPPTSRPMPRPASAAGPSAPSSARCAKASRATGITCTPPSPTPPSRRRATTTCRRSTPTSCRCPPVRAETPPADLEFPFGLRPLMAGWNALFHDPAPFQPVAAQSAEWNRGAYLVNGLGPLRRLPHAAQRDGRGAGRRGLPRRARWSTAGRRPRSPRCRTRRCPGTPTRSTATCATAMRRTMVSPTARWRRWCANSRPCPMPTSARWPPTLLPSIRPRRRKRRLPHRRSGPSPRPRRSQGRLLGPAQRMFDSACAACHHDGDGPTLLGVNTPLALNSNLTSARPDNLLRTILDGVREPASRDIGFMPAFREALDDAQIAELAGYMRARFAPQEPAWTRPAARASRACGRRAGRRSALNRHRSDKSRTIGGSEAESPAPSLETFA